MRNNTARSLIVVLLTLLNLGLSARPARAAIVDLGTDLGLSNSSAKHLSVLEKDLFRKAFPLYDAIVPESVVTRKLVKARGSISSYFGMRVHPIYRSEMLHSGIDIKARKGAAVASLLDGKVAFAGWMGGYGKVVVVEHTLGWTTYYAHLSGIDVAVGDYLLAGETLGKVGSTGTSTGNHLHFEIRYLANAIDPMKYFAKHL